MGDCQLSLLQGSDAQLVHKPSIRNLGRLLQGIFPVTLNTSPRSFPASLKQEPYMLFVLMIADTACGLPVTCRYWPSPSTPGQPSASTHKFPFGGFSQECRCSSQLLTCEWEENSLNFLAPLWWDDSELCSLLLSIVPQRY